MKRHIIFIIAFFSSICHGQIDVRPAGVYQVGDTSITVKYFNYLNSIREFKKINGTFIEPYRDFYMDTRTLHEEGAFNNGMCIGIWKFYSKNGNLEKEINYDSNIKTFYGITSEPYDDVLSFITKKADSLLITKFGADFFQKNIIQNTNRSYHYGNETSGLWFEIPENKPTSFLMRYDLKIDSIRFDFFEFMLDSLGKLKVDSEIEIFSNFKNQPFITIETAEKIALKNGLSEKDQPFKYCFSYNKTDNIIAICVNGSPYNINIQDNLITKDYIYILLDAWTGDFILKDKGKLTTVID